jgi:predicted HicB family RNase H-like nuclease
MPDYTLRKVPGDLHKAWKIAAAMKSISMRDYLIIALRAQVSNDLAGKEEASDE